MLEINNNSYLSDLNYSIYSDLIRFILTLPYRYIYGNMRYILNILCHLTFIVRASQEQCIFKVGESSQFCLKWIFFDHSDGSRTNSDISDDNKILSGYQSEREEDIILRHVLQNHILL